MMTSTIRKFGVGVASLALVASAAAPAFAAPDDDVLPGLGTVTMGRLSGVDRIATSLKVADHAFAKKIEDGKLVKREDKPTTVYITNADDSHLIDATTAGKIVDGPIVFVKNNSYVAEAVGAALKDESGKSKSFGAFNKVVAIGGESSVSDATLALVAKKAGVARTERIAGKDRYETAVKIAEYIYKKAMDGDRDYKHLLTNTNLKKVYISNGTDNHLVDSMVGGVLDGGPTLLAAADGSLSEETQAFIKKTLPGEFIALGGDKAVSDKTVNDAWLIKALKNDWTESSDIPGLKKAKAEAQFLLDGKSDGTGTSRNPKSSDFMGLKKAVSVAVRVRDVWSTSYQRVRLDANEAFAKYVESNPNLEPSQMIANMRGVSADLSGTDLQKFVANLILLYGDAITNANSAGTTSLNDLQKANLLKGAFTLRDGKVTGFDFGSFETFPAIADKVTDAKADLVQWWGQGDVDADHIQVKSKDDGTLSYIAIASQKESDDSALNTKHNGNGTNTILGDALTATAQKNAASAPLAAVKEVSAWVAEEVKKNRDAKQAEYEAAAQALRDGLDKVAPKTVLRLGGKDRYETASYIATQYMKEKTGTASWIGAKEFYVANGVAYADAIVAGQLKLGPVLLVPAEGDLPASVSVTAASLPVWNTDGKFLNGYGIGGTKVLPEEQLSKVVAAARKNATASEAKKADPFTAADIKIFPTNSTGVEKPLLKSSDNSVVNDANLTGNSTFKIYNSNDVDVTTAMNGKITISGDTNKVKVVTSNAPKGTYTVKFTVAGQNASFKVKVVDETFTYAVKSSDAAKAMYTLGQDGVNVSDSTKIKQEFALARTEEGKTGDDLGTLTGVVVLNDQGQPAPGVSAEGLASGKVRVSLDLTSAKYGTYTVKGLTGGTNANKPFEVTFKYEAPALSAYTATTADSEASDVSKVSYVVTGVDPNYASSPAYFVDTETGVLTNSTVTTEAAGGVIKQDASPTIADKYMAVLKDNQKVLLFKTQPNLG